MERGTDMADRLDEIRTRLRQIESGDAIKHARIARALLSVLEIAENDWRSGPYLSAILDAFDALLVETARTNAFAAGKAEGREEALREAARAECALCDMAGNGSPFGEAFEFEGAWWHSDRGVSVECSANRIHNLLHKGGE